MRIHLQDFQLAYSLRTRFVKADDPFLQRLCRPFRFPFLPLTLLRRMLLMLALEHDDASAERVMAVREKAVSIT